MKKHAIVWLMKIAIFRVIVVYVLLVAIRVCY